MAADEPSVSLRSLPQGYSFIRKGNAYITGNCRRQTQAVSQTVHVVLDSSKKKQLGIAVPTAILQHVRQQESETRAGRAANVQKRDASIEKSLEKLILHEFPRIPSSSLPRVLNTALQKGKGKVGRTGTLTGRERARLAVRAHIRHAETPYDQLLRSGTPRDKARDLVASRIESIARSWGRAPSGRTSARPKPVQAKAAAVKPTAVKPPASVSAARTTAPAKLLAANPTGTNQENVIAQLRRANPPRPSGQGTQSNRHPPTSPILLIDLTDDDHSSDHASPQRKPLRDLSCQQRRMTRSTQRIEHSIQVLAQRLPDSPAPMTPPRSIMRSS